MIKKKLTQKHFDEAFERNKERYPKAEAYTKLFEMNTDTKKTNLYLRKQKAITIISVNFVFY